jgi:hypothetical protein
MLAKRASTCGRSGRVATSQTKITTVMLVAFVISFIYCFIQTPYFAERARFVAPNRKLTGDEARRIAAETTKTQ